MIRRISNSIIGCSENGIVADEEVLVLIIKQIEIDSGPGSGDIGIAEESAAAGTGIYGIVIRLNG